MSNYFNIKYVSEGPYFNVKGGTPPAPTLPTATYLSTVYGLTSTASISAGGTSLPLKARVGGVYDGDYFTKDNSKQYAFFRYNNGVGYKNAGGIFEVAWSQDNYICAKNVTDGAEDLESVRIAECSSADAQVVTVYDIEYGDASYAFKFNLSGTYYYSVLDDVFRPGEWTDDLAAAGYTEDPPAPPVVLPTVSTVTVYTNNENHYYQEHVTNATTEVVTSYTYDLYTDQLCTKSFSYNSNSLYIVGRIVDGVWTKNLIQSVSDMPSEEATSLSNATVGRILLSNGKIWYVINAGISYSTTQWSGVCKVCSSNQATVVPVYDSSNNAYNAFKFTTDGTDYYYVLDGTQTDWTDDLESIGYRLPKILYLASNKSAVRVSALGPYTYGYELYNEDGSTFISSSLPTLLEAWSDSSESSKIADFSNRIELVIKSNNVVLDGKGSYNTWVQRISVL